MAEKKDTTQQNEGEGNRTAAREYNKAQHDFARSGKVDEKAREARRAVAGANHVRGVAAARDLVALRQGLAPTRRILAKLAAKSGRFNRALSPPNLP